MCVWERKWHMCGCGGMNWRYICKVFSLCEDLCVKVFMCERAVIN